MLSTDLSSRISAELALGRAATNPGKTRVCARRAAGWAIQAHYERSERRDGPAWSGDAMKQLTRLRADPAVPPALRAAAERLSTKVDAQHQLPFTNDPLADAQAIVAWALAKPDDGQTTTDEATS